MKIIWPALPFCAALILSLGLLGVPWPTAIAIVILITAALMALWSIRVSWSLLVVSLTMSGFGISIFGQNLLLEHVFMIILLSHSLRKKDRFARQETEIRIEKFQPRLVVGAVAIVSWFVTLGLYSTFNSPSAASSLKLLAWLLMNILALLVVRSLFANTVQLVTDALRACMVIFPVYIAGWIIANVTSTSNIFVEADYASQTFRLKGLMLEPNLLAGLALLLLCVAYAFTNQKEISPRLFWMSAIILSFSIFITYTRAAWLVLFVVLARAVWTSNIRHRLPVIMGLAATAIIVGLLISNLETSTGAITDTIFRRFESLLDFTSGTGAYRFRTWEIAWREIGMDGWFYGHGYNSFSQSHDALDTSDGTLYLSLLWLALIYDGGLLAFAFFVVAFCMLWATARSGSFWFFASFIVISTSTNPTWYMFPWLLAGVLVRRSEVDRCNHLSAQTIPAGLDSPQLPASTRST